METDPAHAEEINRTTEGWKQGDAIVDEDLSFAYYADLSRPHTESSLATASDLDREEEDRPERPVVLEYDPIGLAVLSQTCDIVRDCRVVPFVEVAPLVELDPDTLEEVRKGRRSKLGYLPGVAERGLAVQLDRVVSVEKALLLSWERIEGCRTDEESRAFSVVVSQKYGRFPFPTDFNEKVIKHLEKRMSARSGKSSEEGRHVDALREVRVRATPDWNSEVVQLEFFFIKKSEPEGCAPNWDRWVSEWRALVKEDGRFSVQSALAAYLRDLTAADFVESDMLEWGRLSRGT